MIQLFAISLGLCIGVAATRILTMGEFKVSQDKTLTGDAARRVGWIALALGLALEGFALFVLPMLLQ